MAKSPTERTLERCRGFKWMVQKVEQLVYMPGRPFPKKRDLFGFIDELAIVPEMHGVFGVQSTSYNNLNARYNKIIGVEERRKDVRRFLMAGNTLEVWGWKKFDEPVDRKLWRPRRVRVCLDDDGGLFKEERSNAFEDLETNSLGETVFARPD